MKKKFRYEAASESEAAFIFCDYNPVMKAKIIEFRSHKAMDEYKTENLTVQIRRQLPIILELIEVESNEQDLIWLNLERMAEWYYFSFIKSQSQ